MDGLPLSSCWLRFWLWAFVFSFAAWVVARFALPALAALKKLVPPVRAALVFMMLVATVVAQKPGTNRSQNARK